MEAKAEDDFVEKEGCDSFCGDGFLCGTKNYPLSKPMVDHNQKRVKAIRRWKICDEITRDLLEWASRVDRSEGRNGGMCVGFILLANGAPVNILVDKSCKTRPSEFRGN